MALWDAGGGFAGLAGFDWQTSVSSFEPSRGVRVCMRGQRPLLAMIYA